MSRIKLLLDVVNDMRSLADSIEALRMRLLTVTFRKRNSRNSRRRKLLL